jgi:hypothetical protein
MGVEAGPAKSLIDTRDAPGSVVIVPRAGHEHPISFLQLKVPCDLERCLGKPVLIWRAVDAKASPRQGGIKAGSLPPSEFVIKIALHNSDITLPVLNLLSDRIADAIPAPPAQMHIEAPNKGTRVNNDKERRGHRYPKLAENFPTTRRKIASM